MNCNLSWKIIRNYPYISRLVISFGVFLVSTTLMFITTGDTQVLSVMIFFVSSLLIFVPYLMANEPSIPLQDQKSIKNKLKILAQKNDSKGSTKKPLAISNFELSISFNLDKRTRIERIQDEVASYQLVIDKPLDLIDTALWKLHNNDYLVVSIKNSSKKFIQFVAVDRLIHLDLPIKLNSSKKEKITEVLNNHRLCPPLYIGGSQLNPGPWFVWDDWEQDDKKIGEILTINCRRRYVTAAQISLDLLKSLYGWDENTKLDLKVDTFNESWWNKW